MIVLREVDDWVAVYKDGERVYEGHSVTPWMLLEVLGIEHTRTYYEEDDYDVDTLTLLDGSDVFPERLMAP